jgi:hypothetical protein
VKTRRACSYTTTWDSPIPPGRSRRNPPVLRPHQPRCSSTRLTEVYPQQQRLPSHHHVEHVDAPHPGWPHQWMPEQAMTHKTAAGEDANYAPATPNPTPAVPAPTLDSGSSERPTQRGPSGRGPYRRTPLGSPLVDVAAQAVAEHFRPQWRQASGARPRAARSSLSGVEGAALQLAVDDSSDGWRPPRGGHSPAR